MSDAHRAPEKAVELVAGTYLGDKNAPAADDVLGEPGRFRFGRIDPYFERARDAMKRGYAQSTERPMPAGNRKKVCPDCGERKPLSEYHLRKVALGYRKGNVDTYCMPCSGVRKKAAYDDRKRRQAAG